ncbi:MAG: arsenate reductase family protein [Atopobiaceae bacterium]
MNVVFIEYPRCTTCKRAKKWLEEHGIDFTDRHIVEQNPTSAELSAWHKASGLPLRRFFNTSGTLYREMGLKDKLNAGMSDEEGYQLLATNGMLVKRPILLVDGTPLTPGFKETEWAEALGV